MKKTLRIIIRGLRLTNWSAIFEQCKYSYFVTVQTKSTLGKGKINSDIGVRLFYYINIKLNMPRKV